MNDVAVAKQFSGQVSYNLSPRSVILPISLMRGGEGVTMKLRSMANGMTTGTIGTTAEKDKTCTQFNVLLEFNIWKLTPADE